MIKNTRTEGAMLDYRFKAQTGDLVKLPDGSLGKITKTNADFGMKRRWVTVEPSALTFMEKLRRRLSRYGYELWFEEKNIDRLEKIGPKTSGHPYR